MNPTIEDCLRNARACRDTATDYLDCAEQHARDGHHETAAVWREHARTMADSAKRWKQQAERTSAEEPVGNPLEADMR